MRNKPFKVYFRKDLAPLYYHTKRLGFKVTDMCKLLDCTPTTFTSWMNNPNHITLRHLILMAGVFGFEVESLVYMIIRNKCILSPSDKKKVADKQYMGDILLDEFKKGTFV